ncbi:hypothetical protein [Vulgatibacter incomptus]|uniref:hypothetical protein n=1 Tax=Vulgatibacter incomptus TaxID=1391653 RepID=UPI001F0ACE42|nr:hypothetical protein [Vulgatibacter incomptus]
MEARRLRVIELEKALAPKSIEEIEYLDLARVLIEDLRRRFIGKATLEDRSAGENGLLARVEELPGQRERPEQGAVTSRCCRAKQLQALFEPGQQRPRGKDTHPCCCQLDRQRDPIEPDHQLFHCGFFRL